MVNVNGKSVRLYNEFREVGGEYHLSVDELYLYSVLRRLMNYDSKTITNVDVLEQYTRNILQSPYHSRTGEAKTKVRNSLESLLEKGVIHDNSESIKNNTMLEITFAEMSDVFKHYESIPFKKFESFTDRTLFYIYFVVASWKGSKGGFNSSYNRWADILDVTVKTAEKYVDRAVEEGIIHVNTGDYSDIEARYGQKKRDSNTYSIYPFKEDDKTPAQKKKEQVDVPEPNGEVFGNSDYSFNTGNWLNFGRLDVDDYVIYFENIDNKDFIADCEKTLRRIYSKSEWFKNEEEPRLIKEAKTIIESKERERKQRLKKEQVKDGQIIVERLSSGAVSPFDTEDVYLDSFNMVKLDDIIYYIDFKDSLETTSVENLVTGNEDDIYVERREYSKEVKEELLYKAKEIVRNTGVFDVRQIQDELVSVREEIARERNKGRLHDEVWEGDRVYEDETTPKVNRSLKERLESQPKVIKVKSKGI